MNQETKEVEPKPLLTVRQVAKILNISEFTVRRYLQESKIKGLKLKRAWRMSLEDINEWLHICQLKVIKEMKEKERKTKGGKE